MSFEVILCDRSAELVSAWKRQFPDSLGVKILKSNLLTVQADAIAVPANSFGYTDGGIDLAISREIFDWKLQDRLRLLIDRKFAGELPVGQALVLPTGSSKFRYIVVAPTMRIPGDVSTTVNAYLAMRAILLAAEHHNLAMLPTPDERIHSLAIPGLCGGTGQMPVERVAYQMLQAFSAVRLTDLDWTRSLEGQIRHDLRMRSYPG